MKKTLSALLCVTLLLALALPVLADEPAELLATAEVSDISKYGNVVLSLPKEELFAAGFAYGDIVTVRFLDQALVVPVCSNYTDVDSGQPGLFAREADSRICVAINMGDFATTYGLAVKTTHEDKSYEWNLTEGLTGPLSFKIRMSEPGGYKDEYIVRQIRYTDDRADYPGLSDAEFANFRAVETTGIGKGVLYRSCSPINPVHNRNSYADAALRAAGVTVVMNLADDESTARAYPGFAESYYSTTDFIALNMGVDFSAAEFKAKLADGMRFFAGHPGIYAVHCTEGKDRAGYVTAILECLMGASFDEVVADYMRTYYNYYGVTQGDERYDVILRSNIIKSLTAAFGVSDLRSADLAVCAAAYLQDCGLSEADIAALKKNLSAAPAPVQPEPAPVPVPAPASEETYVVVAGDCLWNLAKRFYGRPLDWGRIAEANGLRKPYIILIGQKLLIPA